MHLIEIFKPGRHTALSGAVIEFSESDLEATASAYDPALHEAPFVVGHPELDAPAYGWTKSLVYSGALAAEPDQVDPEFADMVNAGRFKKISASFFRPDAPNNPKPGVYYLRHVGFLGAAAPAVKGLKSASFAGGDEGVVEFAVDVDAGMLMRAFRGLREWIIAKFGVEEADRAMPDYLIESVRPIEPPASFAAPAPKPDRQEPTMTPEEIAAREAALKKEQEEIEAQRAEFAERERKIKDQEAKAKRDGIVAFAEGLVKEGRLLPRDRAGLTEFMAALDETAVIEFAEGPDGKETRKTRGSQWLREFLARLPQQVDYAERARPGTEGNGAAVNFAAPHGYSVDPARLELHNKALAYQASHPNTSYDTALAAVSN